MATLAKPRGYMVDCIFHTEEKETMKKMSMFVKVEGNSLKTIIHSENLFRNRFEETWCTPNGPGEVTCSVWLEDKHEAETFAKRLENKARELGIRISDDPAIKSVRVDPFREVNLSDKDIEKYRRMG